MGRHGVRLAWELIPEPIRAEIDKVAGSPVRRSQNLDGGFSPGPAARCDLADGRTVFVKAAGTELNPVTPSIHRREGQILAMLPDGLPVPQLIGMVDVDDWVALVIRWIDAEMPRAPLDRQTCDRVLDLTGRLALASTGLDLSELPTCADAVDDLSGHWAALRDDPRPGLDEWTVQHLDALATLEAGYRDATAGDHLVHLDLRTDNILLAADPKNDVVVDWPGACTGPPWVDLVAMLPSLRMDGGPEPQVAFDEHPVGRAADPEAVDVFLASIAGYFTRSSLLEAPPGLPTLRQFQAEQGAIARTWLRQRRWTRP